MTDNEILDANLNLDCNINQTKCIIMIASQLNSYCSKTNKIVSNRASELERR